MFGALGTTQTEVSVLVTDNDGNPVEGASVTISGIENELVTDVFGLTEKITLNLGQYNIIAKKDDKEVLTKIKNKVDKMLNDSKK